MKKTWLFGPVTFLAGLALQAVFLRILGPGRASPHWTLLAVLALGGMGKTNLAQNLGFAWGLSLDVLGLSLFGAQGWLLALAGFISGRLARQLNAEKLITQEAMALFGTLFLWTGISVLESVFRAAPAPRAPSAWVLFFEILYNALAAPVVFWLLQRWMELWALFEEKHASAY